MGRTQKVNSLHQGEVPAEEFVIPGFRVLAADKPRPHRLVQGSANFDPQIIRRGQVDPTRLVVGANLAGKGKVRGLPRYQRATIEASMM